MLFLSGGGSEKDSKILDKEFAKALSKNKTLLYIPIAINVRKHPYRECLKWINTVFRRYEIKITMCTNLKKLSFNDVRGFGGIYIGGGNTFKLMKKIRETHFDKILKDFLNVGGAIYGGSAGAIILGKDIRTASWQDKNSVGLKDTKGLDLINGYSVWCHYERSQDNIIKQVAKDLGTPIVALTEKTGLIVCGSKAWFVGFRKGVIFSSERKIVISQGRHFYLGKYL